MNEATIALIVMTLLIFIIFLGFLIWGWKSGQFKNVEDAKYQVFRQNDLGKDNGVSNDDVRGHMDGPEEKHEEAKCKEGGEI